MANVNIFEKFGVKEVANVYFEALAAEEVSGVQKGDIVLFLDTLKVSTIETTAENVDARGGWGNPRLITWDFGKEITLSLTDALLSFESARIMLGGQLRDSQNLAENDFVEVRYTAEVKGSIGTTATYIKNPSTDSYFFAADLDPMTIKYYNKTAKKEEDFTGFRYINLTTGKRGTATIDGDVTKETEELRYATLKLKFDEEVEADDQIRLFWSVAKKGLGEGNEAVEITISPNTFPGTYKIVGDTFMRSQKDGKDYPFQFIIGKAKVLSEVTITMEAEGDPATFDMTINVLKDDNGDMMKMVRYDLVEAAKTEEEEGN